MTYKTDLQTNNEELQELINIANTILERSTGSRISKPAETCTVTLNLVSNGIFGCEMDVMLFDKNYIYTGEEEFNPFIADYLGMGSPDTLTIEIPKNSIIYILPSNNSYPVTGHVAEEGNVIYMGAHDVCYGRDLPGVQYYTFFVYGNCAITATFEE